VYLKIINVTTTTITTAIRAHRKNFAFSFCSSVRHFLAMTDPTIRRSSLNCVQNAGGFCRIIRMSGDATSTKILAGAHERGYDFEVLPEPTPPEELLALLGPAQPKRGTCAAGG
jgi:hypothetical protein